MGEVLSPGMAIMVRTRDRIQRAAVRVVEETLSAGDVATVDSPLSEMNIQTPRRCGKTEALVLAVVYFLKHTEHECVLISTCSRRSYCNMRDRIAEKLRYLPDGRIVSVRDYRCCGLPCGLYIEDEYHYVGADQRLFGMQIANRDVPLLRHNQIRLKASTPVGSITPFDNLVYVD